MRWRRTKIYGMKPGFLYPWLEEDLRGGRRRLPRDQARAAAAAGSRCAREQTKRTDGRLHSSPQPWLGQPLLSIGTITPRQGAAWRHDCSAPATGPERQRAHDTLARRRRFGHGRERAPFSRESTHSKMIHTASLFTRKVHSYGTVMTRQDNHTAKSSHGNSSQGPRGVPLLREYM